MYVYCMTFFVFRIFVSALPYSSLRRTTRESLLAGHPCLSRAYWCRFSVGTGQKIYYSTYRLVTTALVTRTSRDDFRGIFFATTWKFSGATEGDVLGVAIEPYLRGDIFIRWPRRRLSGIFNFYTVQLPSWCLFVKSIRMRCFNYCYGRMYEP